jgi:Fur family zinc uptake transcriptional regulator
MRRLKRSASEEQLDEAAAICSRQGAQLTELRRSVLALILTAEKPSTAYQLLDRLKETRKSAAPPTIYRALDFLIEHRLIHKVERLNAFIPCAAAGHSHRQPVQFLICNRCGVVTEIEDQVVSKALAHAAHRQGFRPSKAVVELDGICVTCWSPPLTVWVRCLGVL